ncbi:elongation factor G-like protein EF-G2 [Pseudonocardia endophytica]|uniref:Elongation factor G n=1 Tax=Pseudonocardia endophytica TaxID=401976 RepID=A0A4R1HNB8_PSEEN|nr:elongation factor G-like protein EF-G2 [Pseudonocardia endophytica]TCK22681.1 elongation factor G [Pseudonocardia endophytica]
MTVRAERQAGGAATAVAAAAPADIRNVVLVGPSGSGKTTLVDALLAHTGTIPRAGSVTEGTTTCDHDPAAVRQHRSIGLSVAPFVHDGIKVNLLDTPGYGDFLGELRAGLRAADAALFVVPAAEGREGTLDPGTLALWEECVAAGIPRAVVVARCDAAQADVESTQLACQDVFGSGVAPCYLPIRRDDGGMDALYGLLSQTPAGSAPDGAEDARSVLIEGIIEQSEDEALMEGYLAGEEIPVGTLVDDLETAVARGAFHPVVPVCSASGIGLDALLEIMTGAFPSPQERPLPRTVDGRELAPDPDGPLAAEVVRTASDPYVGRVSLVRVFSGTLRPDTTVHIGSGGVVPSPRTSPEAHDGDEKVAHLYSALGSALTETAACPAGDICAVTRLSAGTGDTLSATTDPLDLVAWDRPEPLLPIALVARNRGDEDAVARALAKLVATDPALALERNQETHQTVLWCTGEAHADVALSRLRDAGVEVETEEVRVPLRITLDHAGRATGKHVKQSGGHGQYAVCHVEFEPLPPGSGFEFRSAVVGGSVPTQYVPSVEKGIRTQLERGLAVADGEPAHPVVDVKATLVDGKAHSVDSSDAAFQTAGSLALREAVAACGTTLLEPLDEVRIRILDEHLGAVLGDLSGRRGRVLGTDVDDTPGRTVVRAEVPRTELLRHAIDLRAMTSGTATCTRAFARYAERA